MITARDRYQAYVGAVLEHVRNRRKMDHEAVEYRTPEIDLMEFEEHGRTRVHPEDMPADLADLADAPREELLARICELQEQRDAARTQTLKALMNYAFGGGPDPVSVAERIFLLARVVCTDVAWGMKQWEVGALFGDIRQTWQQKEKVMIEKLVSAFSTVVFTNSGGKSVAARFKQALARLGNTSKKFGRKPGDAPESGVPAKSSAAKRRELQDARELARELERERMAEELGVDPDEIDFSRIDLERDD